MKKCLVRLSLIVLAAVPISSQAQGYVIFRNFDNNASTMQLVFDGDSGLPLTSEYQGQLYVGAASVAEGSLVAAGSAFAFGDIPFDGLIIGGEVANPFVTAGNSGSFQLRVWSTNYATWDDAYNHALNDPLIKVGKSAVFQNPTSTSGNGSEIVYNLPAFVISSIPEPATAGMALVAGGLLLYRRWTRRS